jgi:hypothetical protein
VGETLRDLRLQCEQRPVSIPAAETSDDSTAPSAQVAPASDDATRDRKRILLVAQMDGYANGVKPAAVVRFLRQQGHDVHVDNTYYLSRASARRGSLANKLPRPELRRFAVYLVEAGFILTRRWSFARRRFSYYLHLADYLLRRSILSSVHRLDDFDMIICEHPQDAGLLTTKTRACTFYDCPDPYADELYDEGKLTKKQHRKLRRLETELFETVGGLSFSWESYARYALARYGISGRNLAQLNWGCTPSATRAQFSSPPRIVYLGSLSSRYIDLPLLSRLSKLYRHIDVYGGPPPDPALGLNYRGWAPPTILAEYQFGLITCTKDELRRDGFSAKHLDYIAYGLPVLVPAWRRHLDLLRGSIPYDEDTFAAVVAEFSAPERWQRMSDEAYAQAEALTWETTLRPLETLLRRAEPAASGSR